MARAKPATRARHATSILSISSLALPLLNQHILRRGAVPQHVLRHHSAPTCAARRDMTLSTNEYAWVAGCSMNGPARPACITSPECLCLCSSTPGRHAIAPDGALANPKPLYPFPNADRTRAQPSATLSSNHPNLNPNTPCVCECVCVCVCVCPCVGTCF